MTIDLITGSLLIVVGWSMVILYNYGRVLLAEIHNKTVLKNIRERDYIREDLLTTTAATRVSFFRTHNKNGIPSHYKDYKTTCVRGARYQEKMYRDVLVDTHYTNMLLHIMEDPTHYYDFVTKDEPECMLKEYYENEGVGRSMVFYIKSTSSGISYVSFAKESDEPFSAEDVSRFQIGVDQVKRLKNVYHNF